ncbi:MAG: cell wall hydrolase [Pseudomonadota bacterium]
MVRPYTGDNAHLTLQRGRHACAVVCSLAMLVGLLTLSTSVNSQTIPDADAAHCFAQNLYFEARSEGRDGMIAVGWVVLNRVESSKYPNSICAVVHDGGERPPCEFNWWCDGRSDRPTEPGVWRLAQILAEQMLTTPPADPTDGALWFHSDSIPAPEWLRARDQTLHLGAHYFYK